MSGGGATHGGATFDMVDHLKDSHGLALLGLDSADAAWSASTKIDLTGDYVDAPSVMRYIYEKGQTDAGGNPFDGVSSYDPDDDLDAMQTELTDLITDIDALDPDADVLSYLAQSETDEADLATLDVSAVVNTVVAFARNQASPLVADALAAAGSTGMSVILDKVRLGLEPRLRRDHARSVSEFAAPMALGGAVQTSAFVIGVAKLQRGLDDRLAAVDTEFLLPLTRDAFGGFLQAFRDVASSYLSSYVQSNLEERRQRNTYIMSAAQMMVNSAREKVDFTRVTAEMQKEISRMHIVARADRDAGDLDIDAKSLNWDMELFQQGANVMSAVSGSVVPTAARPSRVSSGLSGAAGGAAAGVAAGAQIGAAGGPIGAVGGGIIGGVGGLIAGLTE